MSDLFSALGRLFLYASICAVFYLVWKKKAAARRKENGLSEPSTEERFIDFIWKFPFIWPKKRS